MSAYPYLTHRRDHSAASYDGNDFNHLSQPEEPFGIRDSLYDPSSSFQPSYFPAVSPFEPSECRGDFTGLNARANSLGFTPDFRPDAGQAHLREAGAARGFVGAQYYPTHSINDGAVNASPWPLAGDLSLHTLNLASGHNTFAHHNHAPFAVPPREHGYAQRGPGRYHAGVEVDPAAAPSRSQLPPRPTPPPSTPQRARQPPPITARDFVHMNDAFIATDLPEESPFALVPAGARSASFAGHPYPDGHQWPQTFKITEVKQIGPKKQTLACFFCRARKIACAPRPVDGTEERSCEYVLDFSQIEARLTKSRQCERRGFDCKYPKESKRGQHNRIRGLRTP
ncbi:hypothetical protein DFH09DRAFT_1093277 [Mycena vulgaris]|nr:hypothetical protein DFH09DRAFT_1093277 [Mycena vulgaris]